MQLAQADFGWGFYVVSIVVSALLFFGWRRLFRRVFRAEAAVVVATAMAAIITTPVVLLALLWIVGLLRK
jgi:MFS superfamily sulfate permease-like transporter